MSESKELAQSNENFLLMDASDEQQIMMQLRGEIVDELYYDVNGKKGLSIGGVNLMSQYIGDIFIEPGSSRVTYDPDTEEYFAEVIAVNRAKRISSLGTATQEKYMTVYDRDERKQKIPDGEGGFKTHREYDKFARTKALSKAERNAKRKVIPEPLLVAYLDYFIQVKQGKKVPRPSGVSEKPLGDSDPRRVKSDFKVVQPENLSPQMQRVDDRTVSNVDPQDKGAVIPQENDGNAYEGVGLVKQILIENGFSESWIEENLEMTHDAANYRVSVKQLRYLKDEWGKINDIFKAQRGGWIKDEQNNRNNHWEVPV